MVSREQWGYWRGKLLPSIVEALGVPEGDRRKVAELFHTYLKSLFHVKSFYYVEESDMQWLIGYLHVLFAREFGIMLPEPGEDDVIGLNLMSMREFLGMQKKIYADITKGDPDKGRVG